MDEQVGEKAVRGNEQDERYQHPAYDAAAGQKRQGPFHRSIIAPREGRK